MVGAPTRTDRRRERTRGRLTDATRELIAEKGVAALRIQEITERADVALGSFYNHFDSKEEVVEAVVADSLQNIAETLAADPVEDPAELVAAAIRRFVGLAYSDPDFARLVVHLTTPTTCSRSRCSPRPAPPWCAACASGASPSRTSRSR